MTGPECRPKVCFVRRLVKLSYCSAAGLGDSGSVRVCRSTAHLRHDDPVVSALIAGYSHGDRCSWAMARSGQHGSERWGRRRRRMGTPELAHFLPDPPGVCARRGCGLSPTCDFPDFPCEMRECGGTRVSRVGRVCLSVSVGGRSRRTRTFCLCRIAG